MSVRIESLTGEAIKGVLAELARLRIEVFREWPYIYDGSYDYERAYFAKFAAAEGSLVAAAMDGERLVGAATAAPMGGHADGFDEPFKARGWDIGSLFYLGESVLLRSYRGRGIGHAFFDAREAHARTFPGVKTATFCSVVRPERHPMKPDGYRPLDDFWKKRGYQPVEGLVGAFAWQDIGEDGETTKPMQYWVKDL